MSQKRYRTAIWQLDKRFSASFRAKTREIHACAELRARRGAVSHRAHLSAAVDKAFQRRERSGEVRRDAGARRLCALFPVTWFLSVATLLFF